MDGNGQVRSNIKGVAAGSKHHNKKDPEGNQEKGKEKVDVNDDARNSQSNYPPVDPRGKQEEEKEHNEDVNRVDDPKGKKKKREKKAKIASGDMPEGDQRVLLSATCIAVIGSLGHEQQDKRTYIAQLTKGPTYLGDTNDGVSFKLFTESPIEFDQEQEVRSIMRNLENVMSQLMDAVHNKGNI